MEEVRYMQSKWLYGFGLVRHVIEQLDLSSDKRVLNLGCGFGKTVEYVVQKYGCRVTASDILKGAVVKAEKRSSKGGWKSGVNFEVFDPQKLGEETFDAIIVEIVTTFIEDKEDAFEAYVRALKPGGRIGVLELMWLKEPSRELCGRVEAKFGVKASFLTDEGWRSLLDAAELELVKSRVYHLSLLRKGLDDFRYDGFEALWDLLATVNTIIRMPAARSVTADFLSFFRKYSKTLAVGEYIYLKPT